MLSIFFSVSHLQSNMLNLKKKQFGKLISMKFQEKAQDLGIDFELFRSYTRVCLLGVAVGVKSIN